MAEKKGFDLASVLGDVSKLDTGREQIEYIQHYLIIPDQNNGYSMDGVEDLARSIELVGLQQPLRVRPIPGDTYCIVSGHRRHAAIDVLIKRGSDLFKDGVPCIVDSGEASAALQELQLLLGNSDNRKLTAADEAQQIERISDCIRRLEDEGYNFPGRHRDWVSQLSGISRSKIARIEAISHNLAPLLLDRFNAGRLGISAAYRLSQETEQMQHDVYNTFGSGINDLTAEQLEDAIARRKAPKDAAKPATSSLPGKWNADAYLEERAKEDDAYFEMLSEVAKVFIDELGAVNSRSEGIETLKKEFMHQGCSGPGDMAGYDGSAKGLSLHRHFTDKIFRTWTEVYDMLCTIALNRASLGSSWDVDTVPAWQTGEPAKDGWYAVKFDMYGTGSIARRCLWYCDSEWWLNDRSDASPLDDGHRVICWLPLPEEDIET